MRVQVKDGYLGYYGHQLRREGDVFNISDNKRTKAEAEEHAKAVLAIRPKESKAKIIKALTEMPQEFSSNWMEEVKQGTPLGRAPRRANAPDEMKMWGPKGRAPEFHADIEDEPGAVMNSSESLKEQAAALLKRAKEAEESEKEAAAQNDKEEKERQDLIAEAEAEEKRKGRGKPKTDDDEDAL